MTSTSMIKWKEYVQNITDHIGEDENTGHSDEVNDESCIHCYPNDEEAENEDEEYQNFLGWLKRKYSIHFTSARTYEHFYQASTSKQIREQDDNLVRMVTSIRFKNEINLWFFTRTLLNKWTVTEGFKTKNMKRGSPTRGGPSTTLNKPKNEEVEEEEEEQEQE